MTPTRDPERGARTPDKATPCEIKPRNCGDEKSNVSDFFIYDDPVFHVMAEPTTTTSTKESERNERIPKRRVAMASSRPPRDVESGGNRLASRAPSWHVGAMSMLSIAVVATTILLAQSSCCHLHHCCHFATPPSSCHLHPFATSTLLQPCHTSTLLPPPPCCHLNPSATSTLLPPCHTSILLPPPSVCHLHPAATSALLPPPACCHLQPAAHTCLFPIRLSNYFVS